MLNVLAVEPGAFLLDYSAQKKTVPPHQSLHLFHLSPMGRYTHGGVMVQMATEVAPYCLG